MNTKGNAARAIRMSNEDWNELLVTAINAGYKSRTEYIRAVLKGDKLWSSKQPPAEIEPELYTYKVKWQDAIASLEVYTDDAAKFLARAEAAEAELETLREELNEIRSTLADWYEFGPPTDHTKKKATALRDEITRLQTELQAIKNTPPILENPQSLKLQLDTANARIADLNSLIRSATENKPLRGLKEIVADMPEKTRAKWDAEKWKAETWVKYFLDNK